MKPLPFKIPKTEKESLVKMMKDHDSRKKFEDMVKLNLFRYSQDKDPRDYDCRLLYVAKDDKYVIKVSKIDI